MSVKMEDLNGIVPRIRKTDENIYSRSRRRTPWTDKASVTPLESFLDNHVAVERGIVIITTCFVERSERIRIINARRATAYEEGIYNENFKKYF